MSAHLHQLLAQLQRRSLLLRSSPLRATPPARLQRLWRGCGQRRRLLRACAVRCALLRPLPG